MLRKFGIVSYLYLLVILVANADLHAQDQEEMREKISEAQTATENGEFEKAVDIYRDLNEMRPDTAFIEFQLGYNLHASGKIDEAIEYHEKAAKSEEFKPTALYNLACVYSIKKETDKAFDYLEQSIKAGFDALDTLNNDGDMKNIKGDPRFKQMIAMIENDGKAPEKLKVESLFGDWKIVSGSRAGAKIDSELPTIKITKKTFTIPSGESEDFVMSYKVDMDAKPITVDFKIESGPGPEGTAKGIIKHKNGEMMLCYEPTGKDRPEKFASTEENGFFVFKMKPAAKTETKAAGMAKAIIGKWKCVKGKRAGQKIEAERMESIITIDKKLIAIPVSEDEGFEMSYKIDSSKDPVEIDMKIEAGPAPEGSKALGIIKIEDGKFFLCYDPEGTDRPDKFESSEEDGRFLFEMKRHKK